MTDNKTERLSFRITPEQDKRINEVVDNHRNIRNRTDLGEKALDMFLDYLDGVDQFEKIVVEAIKTLGLQVQDLTRIMTGDGMTPARLQNFYVEKKEALRRLIEGEYRRD